MNSLIILLIVALVCLANVCCGVQKRSLPYNPEYELYKRFVEKRLIDPLTFGSGFSNL
uniref:Secreted peptide prohormone-9 n=1 Tax=Schmidtea mediterranea TaxID=79327 RepID=E3CTK1_SCHMD|nr:TPA_inf: secreted peptide prohormone-9 [Schmidtea mediterranea]